MSFATTLGRLARTTAFKLSAVYLLLFSMLAAGLLGYVAISTDRLIASNLRATIEAELAPLVEAHNSQGVHVLAAEIEERVARTPQTLYLLTAFTGEPIVGNVASFATNILRQPGWSETAYRRPSAVGEAPVGLFRVVALSGGFRLVVGRDLGERERLHDAIRSALGWSVLAVVGLGLVGGIWMARRMLRRIDAINAANSTIMAGDFAGRLPLAGSGDEIDRLSESVNGLLAHIQSLMMGLKEVSDNVAHDLKTPLARLRARADAALRGKGGEEELRSTLESLIAEADGLIGTFDALLTIARAEAGGYEIETVPLDLSGIVRDVAELYEPAAEEAGLTLKVEADKPVPANASRELIGQAIANLIDNAVKYGKPKEAGAPAPITVKAHVAGGAAVIVVEDRGEGIPAKDRERVLERFVRLDAARTAPGSGLGLSLVAAIVKQHGGTLLFTDAMPGLRAEIRLPLGSPVGGEA